MKDWYEILGVDKKASLTDIKYAYKTKALKAHPDHGGDIETMKCLNEAYGTLSDVDKRKDFDDERVVFEESDIDNVVPGEFGGYLGAGNIAPYSERYRKLHAALTREYDGNPLKKRRREQVNALSSAVKFHDKRYIF